MPLINVSQQQAVQEQASQQSAAKGAGRIQHQWPQPLTAREWDRRFPGILDSIGILGAGANVVLQLANLPVGRGVAESKVDSGAINKRPVKRGRTTIAYLAVAMLGTSEEKTAYRSAINTAHAQVRSDPGAEVQYNAFNPDLQLWVAACLYWGFVDIHAKLNGQMSREKQEAFYQLASPLGTTLQVRPEMWPKDLASFEQYWQQGLQKLEVDDKVRDFLDGVVNVRFLPMPFRAVLGPVNRFVTIGFLPPEARQQMRYDWRDWQQKSFDGLMRGIGFANGLLPRTIRQMPFNLVMWDFRRRLRKGMPLV